MKEIPELSEKDLARFWAKVGKKGPRPDQRKRHYKGLERCWVSSHKLSDAARPHSYRCMTVKRISYMCHRISWALANGPIPNGMLVLHRCDNPSCVNPDHLFLGTAKDNVHDKFNKGRANICSGTNHRWHHSPETVKRGEAHHEAKLTAEDVMSIRKLYTPHVMGRMRLAVKFGVSNTTIRQVIRRITWKHVP